MGEPISPDVLSDTLLSTNNFVPLNTVIATPFSALVTDEASFISVADTLIAKYSVFGSIFSGRSPSSLNNLTFSPVWIVWVPIVNTFDKAALFCTKEGPDSTLNTFLLTLEPVTTLEPELTTLSVMTIDAFLIVPVLSETTSVSFAPTR